MHPIITCKSDLIALERAARQDDPSDALDSVESLMEQINTPQILSGDTLIRHFLANTLHRIVVALLKRSEVDDEVETRIFNFLEATLRFIVKTIDSGFDPLLTLLHEIFSEQNSFYLNCSGIGACEDITDIGDGGGADIFNDSSLIQEAIFVDPAPPSHAEYNVRNNNLARFFANINVFGRQAGFRELKAELEKTNPPPSISRIKAILAPVYEIRDFVSADFLLWFTSVGDRVFEMIMGMSDEDLKNDYRAASDAILYMSTLYRCTDRHDGAKEADMRRLQFALKGFRSPFLERRLNSLNDINDILESLDVKDSARDEEYGPFWVTKEFMCHWLAENQVLESIFTRNLHLEVLKRSYRIMAFLAANDRLTKEDIGMIWDVAAGKHETIQKNIYDLLLSITRYIKPEMLRHMLDLIKCLPQTGYTTQHIEMLRMISSLLVSWGSKRQIEYQFLGPEILWDLVQDDVRFSQPELNSYALQVLVEVLEIAESRSIRGEYFTKCAHNLTRHKSVPQSLVVMTKLLSSLTTKRKKPELDWAAVDCVRDEQQLLELVVEDLVIYQTKASTLAQAQGLTDRQVLITVFDGLYPHSDQLDRRQTFVSNMLERPDVTLSFSLAGVLWTSLVCNALSKGLQDFSLRWFEQIFSSQWTRQAVADCAEPFFLELLCRQGVANLSDTGFSLFRCLMKLVNWKRTWLTEVQTPNQGNQLVVTNFELVGMQSLWDIAVVAQTESVASQAIAVLNELYQNLSPALQDRVAEKREEYVKNCMQHMLQAARELQKSEGQNRMYEIRMNRCIRLLKTMLSDFEAKASASGLGIGIRKHGLRLRGEQITLRLQRFTAEARDQTKELPRVKVFSNSTLGYLRREIAKVLNEDIGRLRLIARGAELKDDSKTIAELKFGDGETVHLISRPQGTASESQDVDMGESRATAEAKGERRSSQDGDAVMQDVELKVPHNIVSRIYFEEIFKMLDSGSQFITSQLWDLLMTLPTNAHILEEIRNLGPTWSSSLPTQSVYGLLYSLQVVESLLDDSAVHGGNWASVFIENGGLEGLLDVMLSPRFESPESAQGSECLALLLKLISSLTVGDSRTRGTKEKDGAGGIALLAGYLNDGQGLDAFIHRLMNILADSAAALSQKQTNNNSLDSGREKVGSFAMDLLTACAMESAEVLESIYRFPHFCQWIRQVLLHNGSPSLRQELARCILQIAQGARREIVKPNAMNEGATPVSHPRIFFLDHILPLIRELAANSKDFQPISHRCTDLFGLANELLRPPNRPSADIVGSAVGGVLAGAVQSDAEMMAWNELLSLKLDEVAVSLTESLISSAIVEERNGTKEDQILVGVLRTLQSLLSLRPELRPRLGGAAGMNLLKHIFVDCLFSVPTVECHQPDGPPKCKMQRSRVAAFDLLLCLVDDCPETYSELLSLLLEQYQRRELRALHFYQPSQMDKAPCGYVGLRNLGATCYMNSLLQQLFLIPELRAAILQVPIVEEDKANSLMYQLQALLGFLQESERQYYETKDLCHAYRDYDGLPVNTSQQMDVDEYFNMLFDKLEKCLKGTPQERILQDCFGGKVVNQIICKEPVRVGDQVFGLDNPFKSEREEKFFTLQLEVKHKRNILESLDLFVEGEMLEGDNKYFCEEANQKVDAMKRVCIKELPRTLILHLKRFEFDLDFMKKVKVNDCCEFPTCLNMHPYTLDGIEQREKAAAEAARNGLDPAVAMDQISAPEDCQYELVGVLVHTGTADSGHYYSYIKERVGRGDDASAEAGGGVSSPSKREGHWFLFNDTHVEQFDDKEIGAACYGGNEYVQQMDAQQRPKCVPRSYNAYMLFYERVSTAASPDRLRVGVNSKIRVPLPEEIMRGVWTENLQFLRDKQQYDATYFAFIYNFCSLGASLHAGAAGSAAAEPAGREAVAAVSGRGTRRHGGGGGGGGGGGVVAANRQGGGDEGSRVIQLSILFVMNVLIHSWDTSSIESWVSLIKSLLTPERRQALEWVLDAFGQDVHESDVFIGAHWLREALLHCRVPDARAQLLSLFLHIIRLLAPSERHAHRGAGGAAAELIIPYCEGPVLSAEGRSLDENVSVESVRLHPLLTDVPYKRLYRGGWDPALEPPDDYIAFPRPCTHIGRLLDKALCLLPELPPHWRHFGEFFKLLAGAADLGREERLFLLSRRAVARCVDLFLNDESQFAAHRRHFNRMGDKFSVPNFGPMMELVSVLVRSTPMDADEEEDDTRPHHHLVWPTQLPIVGELDPACAKLAVCKPFLAKALLEGGNPAAVQTLFVHLAWFNAARSAELIQIVCEAIEECHEDEVQSMLDLLGMLTAIPDKLQQYRIDKFVQGFVVVVSDVVAYTDIFKRCVDFLCAMAAHRDGVRESLIKSALMGSKRRDPNQRWLEIWLLKNENENSRTAAHNLVCILAFPSIGLRRPEPPTAPAGISYAGEDGTPPGGGDGQDSDGESMYEADDLTEDLFELLLAAVSTYLPMVQTADSCRPTSTSRMAMLFRCIAFIVERAVGDLYVNRLLGTLPELLTLLETMNEWKAEMDYNRAELYRVLLRAAERSTDVLDNILADSRWMESLVQNPLCSLVGKAQKANLAYNKNHLPCFFELMHRCCAHNRSFSELYVGSNFCYWAVIHVVCNTCRHVDAAMWLVRTVDVALEWERRGHAPTPGVSKLRRALLETLLSRRQVASAPEHSIPILARIMFADFNDVEHAGEELVLLMDANVLNILVAAAARGPAVPAAAGEGGGGGATPAAAAAGAGARATEPLRLSAILLLDKALAALQLLERSPEDEGPIRAGLVRALQQADLVGLATALVRALAGVTAAAAAAQHPHPLTPPIGDVRQVQLSLLSSLCRYDDDVAVACAGELLRQYEAAAQVDPVEEVIATRHERAAAARKPPPAAKRPLRSKTRQEAGKKVVAAAAAASGAERAGDSAAGGGGSGAPQRRPEVFHPVRCGGSSRGVGTAGEEWNQAFFDLVLQASDGALRAAAHAKDEGLAGRALRLCVCAALDNLENIGLPAPTQAHDTNARPRVEDLLRRLADASEHDPASAGGGAAGVDRKGGQQAAAARSESAGELDAEEEAWVRGVVRGGGLAHGFAEALGVRLLLVHKDALALPQVEAAAAALMRGVVTGWSSKQVATVCAAAAADVAAAAEAAAAGGGGGGSGAGTAGGRGGRGGLRGSAGNRDAAAAEGMLREVRPLVVMAGVPALVQELVRSGADQECASAVGRVLDGGGGGGGGGRAHAEVDVRCEELSQALAALAAAARAVREG